MTVAVIGATGTVGTSAVRQLLARQERVRILVRDPAKAERLFPAEGAALEIVEVALHDLDGVSRALQGVTAAFTALGPAGQQGDLQRQVIAAAARSAVPFYLRLSVLGMSPDSLGLNQRQHAAIAAYQKETRLPGTQLCASIFATGILAAASAIRATGGWSGTAPNGRQAFVDPADVAEAAAVVLSRPQQWPEVIELPGPQLLSYTDVAASLTSLLGRKVDYRSVDDASFRATAAAEGVPEAEIEMTLARNRAVEAGELARLNSNLSDLLGRPPRTLAEVMRDHRGAFLA